MKNVEKISDEKDKHEENQRHFFSPRTADLPEEIVEQEFLRLRKVIIIIIFVCLKF